MLKTIVGLGAVFLWVIGTQVTPGYAVLDCASEYNGYCSMCKLGYALFGPEGAYGCDGGPNNAGEGMGTNCSLICHKDMVCVESSYMSKEGTRHHTYRINYSLGTTVCLMPNDCYNGVQDERTVIDTFCKSADHYECTAGYYGKPNSGGSCMACGNSGTVGFYTNAALTATVAGKSYGGESSAQTSCYIPSGTYYDETGTFTISSNCYYKS